MYLFRKKSGTLRPLPAGIPIEGTNYSKLRESIQKIDPLIDEQMAHIKHRNDKLTLLFERQKKIHHELIYHIAPEAIGTSEPWLMEFNDQRCAMEMKGITLSRLLKEYRDKCVDEHGSTDAFTWQFWEGYLDNYTILKYLLNRMLKELADYEHGKWYWVQNELPIVNPPFRTEASATTTTTTTTSSSSSCTDPEKAKQPRNQKPKHVGFERRVQGWYFNQDDPPVLTGTGLDDKERKKAAFQDRVVDGKATTKALVENSYKKKGGYERCTEGFRKPVKKVVPYEYRLTKFRKMHMFPISDR